jgi:hypothetical protein
VSDPAPYGPQPAWHPDLLAASLPDLRWRIGLLYWDTAEVTYRKNRNVLITNSPLAAGLFYGVRAVGNAAVRGRARQLSQAQWRTAGTGEVALDERGMALYGSWGNMRVDYAEVASWDRDRDALRIWPVNYYPLLLQSSDVDNLAGWYAHLSHGKLWQPLATETWEVPPQVRTSYWEQRDNRFTCGVPEGWEPLTDPAYLSDVAKDAVTNQMHLLFMLRSNAADCNVSVDFNEIVNPDMVRQLSSDPALFEREAAGFARIKAERGNGAVVDPPRVVLMNGERATVIDTTAVFPHGHVQRRELYVGRRGHWFMVGFAVAHPTFPQPYFDRIAPEFQAMLATWQWRS